MVVAQVDAFGAAHVAVNMPEGFIARPEIPEYAVLGFPDAFCVVRLFRLPVEQAKIVIGGDDVIPLAAGDLFVYGVGADLPGFGGNELLEFFFNAAVSFLKLPEYDLFVHHGKGLAFEVIKINVGIVVFIIQQFQQVFPAAVVVDAVDAVAEEEDCLGHGGCLIVLVLGLVSGDTNHDAES